ncbi:MAG: hypothetical protein Q4A85_09325, partial [Kingella sp. (in: b-proteobacteria)]|nr:hypothetical protein [Kingella sp. (in: b-proteobacteria)]
MPLLVVGGETPALAKDWDVRGSLKWLFAPMQPETFAKPKTLQEIVHSSRPLQNSPKSPKFPPRHLG